MTNLYTLINDQIEHICDTFVDHYPEEEDKIYPYTEIKFTNIVPNNSFSDNNLLEINIYNDKGTDIRDIEGLTDAINLALNRFQYNDSEMNVSINKNTPYRLSLSDPKTHIQRRQLRYIVTSYK